MEIEPYFKTKLGKLYQGNCLEIMQNIPDNSIDMILCDLPYQMTNCKWDKIINIDEIWEEYNRILKPDKMIILTAIQPFASYLINSNLKWFKYDIIWHKSRSTGHLNIGIAPLREHEIILVFANGKAVYNPQLYKKPPKNIREFYGRGDTECYQDFSKKSDRTIPKGMAYPRSVIKINVPSSTEKGLHPTRKPVELFMYLLMTYSHAEDIVLDNCIGSGTTGEACEHLNRKWIGIEIDGKYCAVAQERIMQETKQLKIFKYIDI